MSFDSSMKRAAAHPFSMPAGAAQKSAFPPSAVPVSAAAPVPAAAPAAHAKASPALTSLFGHMTDAGGAAKAAPQALAKLGPALERKAGAAPDGAVASKAAPEPQKAELAAKLAAKTLGKAAPPDQKVAIAAKMAAKATGPEAPSEQKAALKEKLAAAVQAAPDGKKAELVKKVAAATAGKEASLGNKISHFAPALGGGAPPARAPMPQTGGGGPEEAEDDRKILEVDFQQQEWGHWCGPASTRIALSARMDNPPTQQELADQLGTHGGGTDHIGLITNALNDQLGTGYYENKTIPGVTATDEERDLLWKDIVTDIDNNYPIVANIVAPPGDTNPPGYPDDETIYHYVSIIGYDKSEQAALIADPAKYNYRPGFQSQYWLGVDQLADLIARKGYSA